MKRIFLTGFVALFVFAAQAQTSTSLKKHKQSKASIAAAKAKADIAKQQEEKQQAIEEQRLELLRSDSIRKENDRIADSSFATQQTMWKDSMAKVQDNSYAARYKNINTQQAESDKAGHTRDLINKAANLNESQSRQVKNINDAYSQKAKLITDNTSLTPEQQKPQLTALNVERMAKIQAVLGKSKAKRFEKARKAYIQKNGTDSEDAWIEQASDMVKK